MARPRPVSQKRPEMELSKALQVLAECHTSPDREHGFVIHVGLPFWEHSRWTEEEYRLAWEAVRDSVATGKA